MQTNVFVQNTVEEVEQRVDKALISMREGESIFLVAIVDNNVVGTLLLKRETHPLIRHRAALSDEIVNPAFNNMGIPGLLFEQGIVFARALGVKLITGSSRANYSTECFFNENGFTKIGCIPGGYEESWDDGTSCNEILYYYQV